MAALDFDKEVLLRVQLRNAFVALKSGADHFISCWQKDASYPIWAFTQGEGGSGGECETISRERALSIMTQITYADDQDPRDSVICPGIAPCSQETYSAARQLNARKMAFKASVLAMKQARLKILSENPKLDSTLRSDAFNAMGLSRIHLVQVYRQMKLLPERPLRVGFTLAKSVSSICPIEPGEARNRLINLGSDSRIQEQIKRLDAISENERLAFVRPIAAHLRANLTWKLGVNEGRPAQVNASLPLFYVSRPEDPLPEHNRIYQLNSGRDMSRLPRSDQKTQSEPFLPSIHVYLYKNGFSEKADAEKRFNNQ